MPLDADTFPRVRLKLEITLHAILSVRQAFIVVKDPEFSFSIISASCQKSVFKRRPLHVKNVAVVSLEQRCVGIKCERALGAEDGDG